MTLDGQNLLQADLQRVQELYTGIEVSYAAAAKLSKGQIALFHYDRRGKLWTALGRADKIIEMYHNGEDPSGQFHVWLEDRFLEEGVQFKDLRRSDKQMLRSVGAETLALARAQVVYTHPHIGPNTQIITDRKEINEYLAQSDFSLGQYEEITKK